MQTKMHFSAGNTRSVFSEQIKINKKVHVSALLSASFLVVFAFLFVFPVASSFSGVQAASVLSETTLSMTTSDIDLPMSITNANGTFTTSDPASFTVATNNYSGYTLNVHAKTDDADYSKLLNGESELNSISSATADGTGFNNGNWGFKPSKLNSAANNNYLPAPTYTGTTLDTTAQANNEANSYTIELGAKANYGQAAGKYSNTFVIAAVANPVGYSITYNENAGGDTVTNMPANQTGDASAQSIEISSTTPSRNGYSFIDWCDGTTIATSGTDTCSGTVYHPGDDYDTDQTAQNNLVLKAMWEEDSSPVSYATVNYVGNGLTYIGGGTTNTVRYNCTDVVFPTVYAHTDNVDDAGNKTSNYSSYHYPNKVAKIPGATSLHVVLTYGTNSSDYMTFWEGDHSDYSARSDYSSAMRVDGNTDGKYVSDLATIEFDVTGDAVTFALWGRYGGGYGFYAVVTGFDGNGNSYKTVCDEKATGFDYAEPGSTSSYVFAGWSQSDSAVSATYGNEASILNNVELTYGSEVTLYAVKVANNYTINYNANGGTGSMDPQVARFGETINLSTNTFTKAGYLFNGWNARQDGLGESFGGNEPFRTGDYSMQGQNSITLYAQWVEDTPANKRCVENCEGGDNPPVYEAGITIQRAYELAYTQHHMGMYEETANGNGIYQQVDSWNPVNPEPYKGYDVRFAMQDIDLTYNDNGTTRTVCDLITVIGDQYRALDVRDNKLYFITKANDGHCWMTQNLDLNITTQSQFTHATTDLGWTNLDATASWNPNVGTSALNNGFIAWNEWTNDERSPYSAEPGEKYVVTSGTTDLDSEYSSLSDCARFSLARNAEDCMHYHVGNYYTWSAAIAMNDSSSIYGYDQTGPEAAPNSICPKGWRLPNSFGNENYGTDTDVTDFSNLLYQQGITTTNNIEYDPDYTSDGSIMIRQAPLYMTRAGTVVDETDWSNNRVRGRLNDEIYLETGIYFTNLTWSYTSYGLAFSGEYPGIDSGEGREGVGASIRCIAR